MSEESDYGEDFLERGRQIVEPPRQMPKARRRKQKKPIVEDPRLAGLFDGMEKKDATA